MSVYLSIDSGTPTFLASVTGWGDFSEWIGGQEDVEEIAHLCDHGWGEPATAIAESVRTALRSDDPSEDVKSTAENLLSILDGLDDEVVTVNDGMGPATEDFAEDAAGHEHDSKTGQFTGKSGTTGRTLFEHQNSIRQRANEHKKKNKKLTDEAAFDKSLEEHGGSWKQRRGVKRSRRTSRRIMRRTMASSKRRKRVSQLRRRSLRHPSMSDTSPNLSRSMAALTTSLR